MAEPTVGIHWARDNAEIARLRKERAEKAREFQSEIQNNLKRGAEAAKARGSSTTFDEFNRELKAFKEDQTHRAERLAESKATYDKATKTLNSYDEALARSGYQAPIPVRATATQPRMGAGQTAANTRNRSTTRSRSTNQASRESVARANRANDERHARAISSWLSNMLYGSGQLGEGQRSRRVRGRSVRF